MSAENWRNKCTDIKDEQLYMYDNEIETDCTIIVYENNDESSEKKQIFIKAHKNILSRASTVFDVMFKGEYVENMDGMIKITDIRPKIMKSFLRFIYGQEHVDDEFEVEDILDLLFASSKYDITRLTNRFYVILKKKFIQVETILRIKNKLRDKFAVPVFKTIEDDVFQIIMDETKVYLDLEDALEMTEEDLIKVVQADHLSLNFESELIEFVNNWVHYQLQKNSVKVTSDKLRKLLQNIIPSIRVLTLTAEMYFKTIDTYTWFTFKEKLAILKYITFQKVIDFDALPNICEKKQKRCILKQVMITVPDGLPQCPKVVSLLYFKPARDFFMVGLHLKSKVKHFSSFENEHEMYNEVLVISVAILKDDKQDTNGFIKDVTFKDTISYNSIINIDFKEEIPILAVNHYSIIISNHAKGFYPEDRDIFDKNDRLNLNADKTFTLIKKYKNSFSIRPDMIRKIKLKCVE